MSLDAMTFAAGRSPLAPGSDWPEPVPLIGEEARPAFPLAQVLTDEAALVREFVEAVAESVQVPIDMPAMLLLPIAATAIAGKVEVEPRPGYCENTALWSLCLAPPSERKTATMSAMLSPVLDWQRKEGERLGPEIAAAAEQRRIDERLHDNLRKRAADVETDAGDARARAVEISQRLAATPIATAPNMVVSDVTPEALVDALVENQERALVASSEADALDILMGRYSDSGAPNMGVWLAGHSGEPCSVRRRSRKTVNLNRPALSVALIVQPEAVRSMFSNRAARGRGLLSRFLCVYPVSLLGHRRIGGPVPVQHQLAYRGAIERLLNLPMPADGPAHVQLSPGARAEFDRFDRSVEPQLARGGALSEQGFWAGKLPGAVARTALVLHAIRHACRPELPDLARPIEVGTMRAAIALADYLCEQDRLVNRVAGADPATEAAQRLVGWIAREHRERFSKRDAFRGVESAAVPTVEEMEPAIELLEANGYIRCVEHEHEKRAGRRNSPEYLVNPRWNCRDG